MYCTFPIRRGCIVWIKYITKASELDATVDENSTFYLRIFCIKGGLANRELGAAVALWNSPTSLRCSEKNMFMSPHIEDSKPQGQRRQGMRRWTYMLWFSSNKWYIEQLIESSATSPLFRTVCFSYCERYASRFRSMIDKSATRCTYLPFENPYRLTAAPCLIKYFLEKLCKCCKRRDADFQSTIYFHSHKHV